MKKTNNLFMDKIFRIACFLSLFFLTCCMADNRSMEKSSEQDKLYMLFKKEWDFRLEDNPLFATSNGFNHYNHLLPSASVASQEKRKTFWKVLKKELEIIKIEELSEEDKLNREVFEFYLNNCISAVEYETYLTPITAEGGFYLDLIFALNSTPLENKFDFERYLSRLHSIDKFFNENMDVMRLGLKKRKTLPRILLENYESNINPYIVSIPDSSIFFKPFIKKPEKIDDGDFRTLQIKGREAIRTVVVPSFRRFKNFITREYRPAAVQEIGISAQPEGKEFYEDRVTYYTSLDLSPEEVFDKGLTEVERIKGEMMEIVRMLNFKGDFKAFLNYLRTDKQFYATTEKELLKHACYYAKKIDGQLPRFFNSLPSLSYGVVPVPSEMASNYTAGRYIGGDWESNRAGFYWINTSKLPSRPLYVIPALTLHEAVPGHHLQISLAKEKNELPMFRKVLYISAFGEGWALYSEWLGKEMDIYENMYEDFGRLTYEMWRACRLVLDVGIHYKGWSREKAIDYMASNTSLSLHEITTEIDRYIGWPAQALSYKVGELKIKELRMLCEDKLKDKFNVRDFHQVVLKNGCIPLHMLEKEIKAYIGKNTRTS